MTRLVALVLAASLAATAFAEPAALGDAFLLSPADAPPRPSTPTVARRPDGSFVAAWYVIDGTGDTDVFVRLLEADGTPLTDVTPVNETTAGAQLGVNVAVDGDGNFIVVWWSAGVDVFARRFDADGAALAGEFRVDDTAGGGSDADPSIAMAADGRFVVVWDAGADLVGRRYDAAGAAQGFVEVAAAHGAQGVPDVAMRDDGTFVVAFADSGVSDGQDVQVKGFAADGQVAFGPTQVNPDVDGGTDMTHPHSTPSIALDGSGAFQIAWMRSVSGGRNVYLRRYTAAGAPVAAAVKVNSATAGIYPSVGVGPLGSATVLWTDADGETLRARSYGTNGVAEDDAYVVHTTTNGMTQSRRAVAFDADGTFLLAWSTMPGSDSGRAYARRYEAIVDALPGDGNGGGGGGGALDARLLTLLALAALRRRRTR